MEVEAVVVLDVVVVVDVPPLKYSGRSIEPLRPGKITEICKLYGVTFEKEHL